MKQLSLKTSALLMTVIVLFSTLSFTVDLHYCDDTHVATALFSKAESCCGENNKKESDKQQFSEESCCAKGQLMIKGQDKLQLSERTQFEGPSVVFTQPVYNSLPLSLVTTGNYTNYTTYPTPNLNFNFQINYQVFLI